MKPLRVGVIGLGFIGLLHARILHELSEAQLVAVADIDAEATANAASLYGCAAYSSYEEMITAEQLDAVTICAPDASHEPAATFAATHNLAVLLEKPIANTAMEALAIQRETSSSGTRLMIGHLLHFDPRYAQLRDAAASGRLGEIIHLYFRRTNPRTNGRRLGGKVSIFWYIGIHDIEMMLACAGSKPVSAFARQVSKVNADIGCEDSVFAMIEFENGAIGVVELSWALPENAALGINTYAEVVGRNAASYVNILDQGISIITDGEVLYPDTLHWPEYNGQVQGDLRQELQHFVTATLSGTPYITDTENAIEAVRVVEACFESIRDGLPVAID